jgi:hypothetical protein
MGSRGSKPNAASIGNYSNQAKITKLRSALSINQNISLRLLVKKGIFYRLHRHTYWLEVSMDKNWVVVVEIFKGEGHFTPLFTAGKGKTIEEDGNIRVVSYFASTIDDLHPHLTSGRNHLSGTTTRRLREWFTGRQRFYRRNKGPNISKIPAFRISEKWNNIRMIK